MSDIEIPMAELQRPARGVRRLHPEAAAHLDAFVVALQVLSWPYARRLAWQYIVAGLS